MKDFKRGIPMTLEKGSAPNRPIQVLTDVSRVYLPLTYGNVRRLTPVVADYDTVERGGMLGKPTDQDDAALYSSVTGVVAGMTHIQHPIYGELTCSAVDRILTEEPVEEPLPQMPDDLTAEQIIAACHQAGIVDELDGVQLHTKLRSWADFDTPPCLLLDAIEAEPYQSCAYAVLKAYGRQVLIGLRLAAKAAGIPMTRLLLHTAESRVRKMAAQFDPNDIREIKRRRYPVFNKEPSEYEGKCGFVGTQACLALYRAVAFGAPHIDGFLTVAGDALETSYNLQVPFGTPIEDALQACGIGKNVSLLLIGDALTGVEITDRSLPILPGMTCLVALRDPIPYRVRSCIGCGQCAAVCHKGLLPYEIAKRYENMQYERLTALEPEDCDGCGVCSAVCPAHRPIAQTVLQAGESAEGTIFVNWGDESWNP